MISLYSFSYLVGWQNPDLGLVALPLQRAKLDLVRRQLRHVERLAQNLIKFMINKYGNFISN